MSLQSPSCLPTETSNSDSVIPSPCYSERPVVTVEYLGIVYTPMWTQPHPRSPAPVHGLVPQLLVSKGTVCAWEGIMMLKEGESGPQLGLPLLGLRWLPY